MKNLDDLLLERIKKKNQITLETLAEKSAKGQLSPLAGVFKVAPLASEEESLLEHLLCDENNVDFESDLLTLKQITAEVKAIHTQSIILHGERIKKAQTVLKKYQEGSFTAWLIGVYGNRQTPYNFLQYYELYEALKEPLKQKLLAMPKQAAYALASRKGPHAQKEELIEQYHTEPKASLLSKIRDTFPLALSDKRKSAVSDKIIQTLSKLVEEIKKEQKPLSRYEQKEIDLLLKQLKEAVHSI